MRGLTPLVSLTILIALTQTAHSDGIKLLPPVESSSNASDDANKQYSDCTGSVTGKVLTWDGKHPLKCSSQVFIDSNGNVGIGSQTPQTQLDVNGTINSKKYYLNNKAMAPTCSNVYANSSTFGGCGFSSAVYCPSDTFALAGGGYGLGNDALQNSSAIVDSTGKPVGWQISVYDISGNGSCSSNCCNSPGNVSSGTPPSFWKGNEYMSGGAVVTCCHY